MYEGFAKTSIKITSLIVVSSIIGLSLTSLLPLSSEETTISGETVTVYHNLATMEKSDNGQLNSLAEKLRLINICFWLLIIFGLISSIGIILYESRRLSSLSQGVMLIGCVTIIIGILIVFLHCELIIKIGQIDSISAAFIVSGIPIMYAYLPLIAAAISSIGTVVYTGFVGSFLIKHIINSTKQKKSTKKQRGQKTMEKQPPKEEEYSSQEKTIPSTKEEQIVLKRTSPEVVADDTHEEIEDWLMDQTQHIQKQIKSEKKIKVEPPPDQEYPPEIQHEKTQEKTETPKQPFITKKPPETKEASEKPITDEQPEQIPEQETTSETIKERSSEDEEPPTSPLFEDALSSAIQKRKPGTPEKKAEEVPKEPAETEIKKEESKERITVRCPECKNVFTVEKEEDVTRIECPKCGKKGVVK